MGGNEMEYRIVAIKMEERQKTAVKVQDVLTEYGCLIKVRLGLHNVAPDQCSPTGLILLEVIVNDPKAGEMLDSLNAIEGVQAKEIII
jgi:hypothetical protein